SIPGASCCPNGELALRASVFAPDPETTIVVNCAGRTRSIIGAQTLIDFGVPNRVVAMENGTQGWVLAGLELAHGSDCVLPEKPEGTDDRHQAATALAARYDVEEIDAGVLIEWVRDAARTVYLLDVRSAEERITDPKAMQDAIGACNVIHAPGGQLLQATDQWIGVRNASLVVLDTEAVRAPVTASWLRRLGHSAYTLAGGLQALEGLEIDLRVAGSQSSEVKAITVQAMAEILPDEPLLLDLRSSASYREAHIPGSIWTTRPRLPAVDVHREVILIADDDAAVAMVAKDLAASGVRSIQGLVSGLADWVDAGLAVESSPDCPADGDRIDFQSFTAGRHDGDEAASRQYLAWEIALVDQLDAEERSVFRV
ncbi:MAG: sulfurtransferase, partial [Pseudomonadota bacterium]